MQLTIGIDISKHRLDAYRPSDGRHIQVANDGAGLQALLKWIGGGELPLVVFEATGAYHRRLEAALSTSGIPFARVNPRQSRRFAEATGRLAKTDLASTRPCWRGWELFWSWKGEMLHTRTCTTSRS
jgi:transposase